jgi:hypothetical protein
MSRHFVAMILANRFLGSERQLACRLQANAHIETEVSDPPVLLVDSIGQHLQ